MPRRKAIVPIRNHYSRDLKHQVIYQFHTLGKTTTEIATDLLMPLRVRLASSEGIILNHRIRDPFFARSDTYN